MQVCLFCGGDASEPGHRAHCDGRQGRVEAEAETFEPRAAFLPTPAEARAQREAALGRTRASAERLTPEFTEQATAVILSTLTRGPASAEELTIACRQAGIAPPKDDRAFGPVYMRLARAGRIEKIGAVPRLRGHHTAGGNLWRLVG